MVQIHLQYAAAKPMKERKSPGRRMPEKQRIGMVPRGARIAAPFFCRVRRSLSRTGLLRRGLTDYEIAMMLQRLAALVFALGVLLVACLPLRRRN